MRNKVILLIGGLASILGILSLYFISSTFSQSKLTVRLIDNKGIYIGNGKSGLESAPDEASQFNKTVKALNEGWENVRLGDSYKRVGEYEKAIEAYKKAYIIDPGNRVFTGLVLIETYEHLSRYDDALLVLNELSSTQPISEYGVKKYAAIRNRLLAAKENKGSN